MINVIGKSDNVNANKWVFKADGAKAISTAMDIFPNKNPEKKQLRNLQNPFMIIEQSSCSSKG